MRSNNRMSSKLKRCFANSWPVSHSYDCVFTDPYRYFTTELTTYSLKFCPYDDFVNLRTNFSSLTFLRIRNSRE